MFDTGLSKNDANASLDLIYQLLKCSEPEILLNSLSCLNQLIVFDHVRSVYGDKKEFMTKKMDAFHLLTPFPIEWEQRYHEKGYVIHDPVALAPFYQSGLMHWSDARQIYRTDDSKKIEYEAASFGLKDGWVFSYEGQKSKECAVVSLSGDSITRDSRSRTILRHILPHLAQAIIRIYFNNHTDRPGLTRREKEILTWTARGKTAWEISVILGISSRTVEFHISNILKKLGAVNSPQAVAVAMDFGLLNL
jgi:DNA-binding CsgD family transcriptional regulator